MLASKEKNIENKTKHKTLIIVRVHVSQNIKESWVAFLICLVHWDDNTTNVLMVTIKNSLLSYSLLLKKLKLQGVPTKYKDILNFIFINISLVVNKNTTSEYCKSLTFTTTNLNLNKFYI